MSTYTINDIATMTGLSTRTVREYMKLGFLSGEKENGVWRFTDEAVGALFANGAVAPSIKAKRNALVYDFMLDEKKKNDELCAVLDLMAEGKDAMDISAFFCSAIITRKFLSTHRTILRFVLRRRFAAFLHFLFYYKFVIISRKNAKYFKYFSIKIEEKLFFFAFLQKIFDFPSRL